MVGLVLALVMTVIKPNASPTTTASHPSATATAPTASPTPAGGKHISNVQIGIGDERGMITTATTTFTLADTIDIDYIATTQESNATALLRLVNANGALVATIGPLTLQPGAHNYYYTFVMKVTGRITAQLQYNGVTEATLQFTVK